MFDKPLTTLGRAEEFFKSMGCSSFHMSREYPERYGEYKNLKISKKIEQQWTTDEFNRYYAKIMETTDNEGLWNYHSSMYNLFVNIKTEKNLMMMRDVTKNILPKVPNEYKVVVAETINGRTAKEARNGLIFLSYDMHNEAIAKEFADLSLQFSKYSESNFEDTAMEELYGVIPLQVLGEANYKSHHIKRYKKAVEKCNDIWEELK